MKNYYDFIKNALNLDEALITFGGKAYPKFGQIVIIAGGAGCLAKGTSILNGEGLPVLVEDLKIGDTVMGSDGKPKTIKNLYNGFEDMLKITTIKGDEYISNRSHLHSFICNESYHGLSKGEIYNLKYDDYIKLPKEVTERLKIYNLTGEEFDFTVEELPVNEYFGFELDSEDPRFILSNFIVTHNSGKGFVLSNLLGIDGNVLDVDHLKRLVIGSEKFAAKIKSETGRDLKGLDLSKPDNVSMLHDILSSVYGVTKSNERRIFSGALTAPADRKPNLIFDVTLKDLTKLASITRNVTELGYEKDNIHLVWVVNDVTVVMKQNKERLRVVPEEVLLDTHEGASLTMNKILNMGDNLRKYMNGDIWLAFNKAGVDTSLVKSKIGKGMYIKKSNYIQVKKKGKAQMSLQDMQSDIIAKIASYVPKTDTWEMALGRRELSENIEELFDTIEELLEAVELHKTISIAEDKLTLTVRNKAITDGFEAVFEGSFNNNSAKFYVRKNGDVHIMENSKIVPNVYHITEFFDGVISKYEIDEFKYIDENLE